MMQCQQRNFDWKADALRRAGQRELFKGVVVTDKAVIKENLARLMRILKGEVNG